MNRYSEFFIDRVKSAVPISSVIGARIKLKKTGGELKGLSPFTNEKTPSFFVNDQKGFYHCFSSGNHGDAISFLMECEGYSFIEAVEYLAEKAGIELPAPSKEEAYSLSQKKDIISCLSDVNKFYVKQLFSDQGVEARNYLKSLGYTKEDVLEFSIGFSPNSFSVTKNHLKGLGYSEKTIEESGLLSSDDSNRLWDRFRNRIMYSIHDPMGKVISFSGRGFNDEKAKYVNGSETSVFDKSSTLYNFHRARKCSVYNNTSIIVVEGQTDALSLSKSGLCTAVSSLGTALTENHLMKLWSVDSMPYICMDGDRAGIESSFKIIDRSLELLRPDKSLRFIIMPSGYDPDQMIREYGDISFLKLIRSYKSFKEMLYIKNRNSFNINSEEGRAGLKDALYRDCQKIGSVNLRAEIYRSIMQKYNSEFGFVRSYRKSKAAPSDELRSFMLMKSMS